MLAGEQRLGVPLDLRAASGTRPDRQVARLDAAPGQSLSHPAAALPRLAPWLLRFRAHCTTAARSHGIRALASLNAVTGKLYDELAADGVEFERGRSGILFAYRDPALRGEKVEGLEAVGASGERGLPGGIWTGTSCTRWNLCCGPDSRAESMLRPTSMCALNL